MATSIAKPINLYEDRSGQVLATCISCIVLDILFVSLRITSRLKTKTPFWWDDWTAIAALPLSIGQASAAIFWVSVGLGKHQAVVHHPIAQSKLATFIYQLWYIYALVLVKLSAIFFYRRVFGLVRWYRMILWAAAIMVVAWDLGVTFQSIFACVPVQKFWNSDIPGHCVYVYAEYLGNGIPNAFTDLVIVLLPLPMVFRIHTNLQHKLALAFMFFFSYVIVAVSIARTVVIAKDGVYYPYDYTWYPVRMMILIVLEPGLGLICVCLPPAIKLLEIWGKDLKTWRSRQGSQSSGDTYVEMPEHYERDKKTHRERFEVDGV